MFSRLLPLAAALPLLIGAALPAGAATVATVTASNDISIFVEPYTWAQVVGMLRAGDQVHLEQCLPDFSWCQIVQNGPEGWVPASYLVGSQARIEVQPPTDLTSPTYVHEHTRHGW